jgi:hypothetical protein
MIPGRTPVRFGGGFERSRNFLRILRETLAKHEKGLHNLASVGALAQLVEQRTLNP